MKYKEKRLLVDTMLERIADEQRSLINKLGGGSHFEDWKEGTSYRHDDSLSVVKGYIRHLQAEVGKIEELEESLESLKLLAPEDE